MGRKWCPVCSKEVKDVIIKAKMEIDHGCTGGEIVGACSVCTVCGAMTEDTKPNHMYTKHPHEESE